MRKRTKLVFSLIKVCKKFARVRRKRLQKSLHHCQTLVYANFTHSLHAFHCIRTKSKLNFKPTKHIPSLDWPYLCNEWSIRNGLKDRLYNRQCLTDCAICTGCQSSTAVWHLVEICAVVPSLAHSKTKIDRLISTKAHISCTMPIGELLFQVWVSLDDPDRFYGRSKTGSWHNLHRGGSCNTHTSGFRTTQEAVGTALGSPEVIDCIWHNQCSLKASGGDQLAAKVGCLPQLVRLGGQV
jgi:hypothetical protein